MAEAHRFTGLVGVSGSGKSSLLRAGLVPALQRLPSAARPAAGVSQLRPCPAQPGMTRFAADNGRTGKWGV
ncbi:hypothetical protein [Streptomyces sp. NPDC005827]|uniref:nSTAND1 domain-containing NTPase n=1 Tax=Streptomyces sp. NPDC005827 TaxID=3157070 RepID=UPI0033FDC307